MRGRREDLFLSLMERRTNGHPEGRPPLICRSPERSDRQACEGLIAPFRSASRSLRLSPPALPSRLIPFDPVR